MADAPESVDDFEADEERALQRVRVRAMHSLLDQALRAAERDDLTRYDELMLRLVPEDSAATSLPSLREKAEAQREKRMEYWRMAMAGVLVLGLILIVVYAIRNGSESGATDYVPLVSGLAGIAIGWLYGSSGGHRSAGD